MSDTSSETPRRDTTGRLKLGSTVLRAMSARLRRVIGLYVKPAERPACQLYIELGLGGACHGRFRSTV
jgi:hypothetical protein